MYRAYNVNSTASAEALYRALGHMLMIRVLIRLILHFLTYASVVLNIKFELVSFLIYLLY